ncbi:sensor histidine kinase [Staphylospora marina]|uniref:sensor histidine kinase n=1 Tax=Staphylospora marina TaxID=2490858 RepID=UPI000F5B8AB5|nr:HAMP domain-containing sensor histidine kinase [Staphylospora marina]
MTVRRKLRIALAVWIVIMGLMYAFVTKVVVGDALDPLVRSARSAELDVWTKRVTDWVKNRGTLEGIDRAGWKEASVTEGERNTTVILVEEEKMIRLTGQEPENFVLLFGIRKPVEVDGKKVAVLYYHDDEVDRMNKQKMGIESSTTVLLAVGTLFFILVSNIMAFWLAHSLTAPLRSLLPAIDRLGRGELGVKAPEHGKDEFGKVAKAFNDMSERLMQAEEARRNLTADVAHELRTPLTVIGGTLDYLQQKGEPVSPEQLLPLQDELIRLTRLIDDLHVLSLAEARRLPLEKRPTDVVSLLRRIMERVSHDAENKKVSLGLEVPDEPLVMEADPHRLTQVLLNLLVNAVRYTPEQGAVTVSVRKTDTEQVEIRVADTGIGIEPEHLPHVFNRFYRTDKARSRHSGGSGLGLAIARELVLAHGGTIDVESEPGKGTTFTVRLPGHHS